MGAAIATVVAQFSVGIVVDAMQSDTRQMFIMKMDAFNPLRAIQRVREIQ
jgi:hypothetical protein